MKFKTCLITKLFLVLLVSTLYGQFHKLETENLNLIYFGKLHEYVVPHLASCFENSLRFHRRLFDYTPSEKTTVFLKDLTRSHRALREGPYHVVRRSAL